MRNGGLCLGKPGLCGEGRLGVTEKSVSWVWRPAFEWMRSEKETVVKNSASRGLAFQFLNFAFN